MARIFPPNPKTVKFLFLIASCLQNTDARGILSAIDRDEKYQIDNNKIYSVVLVPTYSESQLLYYINLQHLQTDNVDNRKQSYCSISKLYYDGQPPTLSCDRYLFIVGV